MPVSVVGTDGIYPSYDPLATWSIWNINDVFLGNVGENKHIPKVGDFIIEVNPTNFVTNVVTDLDNVTMIPTYTKINPIDLPFIPEVDPIVGVDTSYLSDTFRAYIDKSTTPYTFAIDNRYLVFGSMSSYIKVFLGTDVSDSGTVISYTKDSAGNVLGENIPLEKAMSSSHNNFATKVPTVGYTDYDLIDGELLTVLVYTDDAKLVKKDRLIVENTNFVRKVDFTSKYVTGVSLTTPFLNVNDSKIIDVPTNLSVDNLNLKGVVHYSDGSQTTLPIDGTRFKLLGLNQYYSGATGVTIDLVLSYVLEANEQAYTNVTVTNDTVVEPYYIRTTQANYSYSFKLMPYPVWNGGVNGYSLIWYLLDLDRLSVRNVTDNITFDASHGSFDSFAYGTLQAKSVSLQLKDVNPSYKDFVFTQMVEIFLAGDPNSFKVTPWTVINQPGAGQLTYGIGLHATSVTPTTLNVSSGFTTVQEWLDNVYVKTNPLVNSLVETVPVNPSHFVINYGADSIELPIADYNTVVTMSVNLTLLDNVYIDFIQKIGSSTLFLSRAAMIIR